MRLQRALGGGQHVVVDALADAAEGLLLDPRRLRHVREHRLVDEVEEDGIRAQEPLQRQVDLASAARRRRAGPRSTSRRSRRAFAASLKMSLKWPAWAVPQPFLSASSGDALALGVVAQEAAGGAGGEGVLGEGLADRRRRCGRPRPACRPGARTRRGSCACRSGAARARARRSGRWRRQRGSRPRSSAEHPTTCSGAPKLRRVSAPSSSQSGARDRRAAASRRVGPRPAAGWSALRPGASVSARDGSSNSREVSSRDGSSGSRVVGSSPSRVVCSREGSSPSRVVGSSPCRRDRSSGASRASPSHDGRSRSISVTAVASRGRRSGARSRSRRGGGDPVDVVGRRVRRLGRVQRSHARARDDQRPRREHRAEDPPLDAHRRARALDVGLVEQPPDEQQHRPAARERDRDAVAARQVERPSAASAPRRGTGPRPRPAAPPPRRT